MSTCVAHNEYITGEFFVHVKYMFSTHQVCVVYTMGTCVVQIDVINIYVNDAYRWRCATKFQVPPR
jgi:hypothetical protein